ncbi:E3 ubiquitin-protein ligase RHF2A-like isoform X2 [Vigna unguiculata]|uniref:E3 ubiquitin-protein ligase RHF2A-like isoform X2 n=1 Tax=Vigna unguiculata TaxID=3917 RepID=UPI0010161D27|nr:E3 ubiquitin-protein ligase RHF2A-like isoform X2 [Vigna unguiculata]
MEVPEMGGKTESRLTSAAAFVEGGIQDACDDSCSICLENFSKSDPATVTNCRHDFHLQCILEWCQRSSQCPMCWQAISLKDATSQELLEAVEQERSLRNMPSRNASIFHLSQHEFQRLPVERDSDIEERILRHLAAAASMRRAHPLGRRESQRSRSSSLGNVHSFVYATHPSAPPSVTGGGSEPAAIPAGNPSAPLIFDGTQQSSPQQRPLVQTRSSSFTSASTVPTTNLQRAHSNGFASHSLPASHDEPQPSEQSFSDSLLSKFNAVSMRYKESISKGTRGWKERLFSPNSSVSELGSEVRRELNAKIASVSRLIERLETARENKNAAGTSVSNHSVAETSNNQNNVEVHGENSFPGSNSSATFSAVPDSKQALAQI